MTLTVLISLSTGCCVVHTFQLINLSVADCPVGVVQIFFFFFSYFPFFFGLLSHSFGLLPEEKEMNVSLFR